MVQEQLERTQERAQEKAFLRAVSKAHNRESPLVKTTGLFLGSQCLKNKKNYRIVLTGTSKKAPLAQNVQQVYLFAFLGPIFCSL